MMLLHTGEADISTRQQRTRKAAKSKAAAELIAGIKLCACPAIRHRSAWATYYLCALGLSEPAYWHH
jgi:hypothetical protein